jgi:hypothetical protein
MPSSKPTHQVASTPQASACGVGSSLAKRRGWPIVKYSIEMRAVIRSWTMPYATAAPMESATMRSGSGPRKTREPTSQTAHSAAATSRTAFQAGSTRVP